MDFSIPASLFDWEARVTSVKNYLVIFFSLMILTAITVWVSFIDLGSLNTVVALGVACIKAFLVIAFFMHVNHSEKLIWLFIGLGIYWLGIMLLFTFADYATRGWGPAF